LELRLKNNSSFIVLKSYRILGKNSLKMD